jgi:heat shock protein HtpX
MALVLLGCALLTAAVIAGVVLLCFIEPSWTPYVLVIAVLIVAATVRRFRSPADLMLNAVDAEFVTEHDEPHLHDAVARMAALADLPPPRVALVKSPIPNAFTTGVSHGTATLVVTTALRHALEEHELDAVIAHELAHVANRDAAVMTVASVPRTLAETIMGDPGPTFYLWFFVWWLGLPIWVAGTVLTLALSRYREFVADSGSALLTGRPESLMSALVKLDGGTAIPTDDYRRLSRVDALWVVGNGHGRFSVFADHPPLPERLARLEEMARTMGHPDGP